MPGKRSVLLALTLAWQALASAADVLPAHLVGTWGTAESLYAGEVEQSEMHLLPDGYGVLVGSTPPAQRLDGSDAGQPGMRAVIGFPLRARLDGATLKARMIALDPADAQEARRIVIRCSLGEGGLILTCTVPAGPPLVMKRRSESVPAETVRTLDEVRSRSRQASTPAASRYPPSIPPAWWPAHSA